MRVNYFNRNKAIAAYFGVMLGSLVAIQPAAGQIENFTSGDVLKKMETKELNAYLTGLIDGFAHARYMREGKKADGGMKCIYDWFFDGKNTMKLIVQAFRKYPKHAPNAIIAAIIKQKCGV